MKTIKQIFDLLNNNERKQGLILFILIMFMATVDMLGVASVFPFIQLLSNPDLVNTNDIFNYLYKKSKIIGVNSSEEFLFVFSIGVFIVLMFSLALRGFTTFLQTRFTLMREYSIGKMLVERYLQN